MALTAHDVAVLNAQARDVGARVGWELHFQADTDLHSAGLTAGPHHIFIVGPHRLDRLTRAEIETILTALKLGNRRIIDQEGKPQLS